MFKRNTYKLTITGDGRHHSLRSKGRVPQIGEAVFIRQKSVWGAHNYVEAEVDYINTDFTGERPTVEVYAVVKHGTLLELWELAGAIMERYGE